MDVDLVSLLFRSPFRMLMTLIAAAMMVAQAAPPQPLFPAREISGTAWGPDDTQTYGIHRRRAGWDLMFHGVVFAQFIYEPPDFVHRTGGFSTSQFSSVNWGMLMARKRAGAGRVGLRTMISLEPWTVPGCGALNFFQTGEVCDGDTIHDRQHPHDLFMEIAADYDRPLGAGSWRWQVYGGPAGEPALGPAAYPHRASAISNPISPIAHHWLDSSHITFGVFTTGVYSDRWKLEGSIFNGREPDDHRADFDFGALDSYSARVSWAPARTLSFQISGGHLEEAEQQLAGQPRASVDLITASAMYHRRTASGGLWATTFAWGLHGSDIAIPGVGVTHRWSNAALAETTVMRGDRDTWFGRLEFVGKPGHDLHAHAYPARVIPITKLQAGYVWRPKPLPFGVGGSASVSVVPDELLARYYHRLAPGVNVFIVLRPPRHAM